MRPAQIFADGFESGDVSRFDANGDNKSDLILRREDNQGTLQSLLVLNGTALQDSLVRIQDVPAELGLGSDMELWGFADVNPDNPPEAIFVGEREVKGYYRYELANLQLGWVMEEGEWIRFLGAADLTGDGFDELIIYLEDSRQVKIYRHIPEGERTY